VSARLLPALLLLGIALFGCGDDDGGGGPDLIKISDFEGLWFATQYEATSVANPQISLEVISMGVAMEFDVDDEGDFSARGFAPASFAGMTLEFPLQGTMELESQDTVVIAFNPEILPFFTNTRCAFTLANNTVTLFAPDATFDFDGDQELEPSIFEGTMVLNDGSYPRVVFVEDFEGHWEATAYTVTNKANPQISINTIEAGATFEFDVDSEGVAVGNAFIPEALAGEDLTFEDIPAAFELVYQDTMVIAFTPEIPPLLTNTRGHFTLDGDLYVLTDEDSYFDFDGDQTPEPAIAVVEMERTGSAK
jgi:hypothetical protein